jgi:predicted Rossmann fold flavoprotein
MYDLIVIGGGAAGFFGAINAAMIKPSLKILILEKSTKLLSKVRISGGGRCNVTHHCFEATPLSKHYPRGQKELKKLFREFQAKDTVDWFQKIGVELKTENDGRMFPVTDNSETIIQAFMTKAEEYKITIKTSCGVSSIHSHQGIFKITCDNAGEFSVRRILVASGGHPQQSAYSWIHKTGHHIIEPIPSLFTFNDSEKDFKDLMGVAVPKATIKIAGTKFSEQGPVLKLSSWAAEYLHEKKYEFTTLINWTGSLREEEVRQQLVEQREKFSKRKILGNPLFNLPTRLWERLAMLADFNDTMPWGEAPQKKINRLVELLIRCPFQIRGIGRMLILKPWKAESCPGFILLAKCCMWMEKPEDLIFRQPGQRLG